MPDIKKPSPYSESVRLLHRKLAVGVILLNLLVYAIAGLSLARSWRQHEARITTLVTNIAQVLGNNLAGNIGRVDMALLGVVDEVALRLAGGRLTVADADTVTARYAARVPDMAGIRVCDAKGMVLHPGGVSVADREYFRYLRDHPDTGLFLAKPARSRITGQWVMILTRRISAPDGRFVGVAVGSIAIETLTRQLASVNMGPHGAIVLRDRDLEVVARYPEPQGPGSTVGQKSFLTEFIAMVRSGVTTGIFTGKSSVDGIVRTYAYHQVTGYPLTLTVGWATADAVAEWRREAAVVVTLALLFSGATLVFSRSLVRNSRSEQQAQADLSALNRNLEEQVTHRTAELEQKLTEHRQAEQALRRSEQRLRDAQSLGRIGDWELDVATGMLTYSEEMNRLLEREPDAGPLSLAEAMTYFLPEDAQDVAENIRSAVATGRGWHHEARVRLPSGEVVWYAGTGTAITDDQGQITKLWGVNQEITSSKLAEAALRESEQKFALTFHSSPVCMALTTIADGRFLDVNEEFLRFFGRTREEVVGQTALELGFWDASHRPTIMTDLQVGATVHNRELTVAIKPGDVRTVLWSGVLVAIGSEQCLISSSLDISERKQAEVALAQARDAAEAANRAKSEFLANMSHEIRTPLNAVMGLGHLALQTDPSPRLREYLTKINTSAAGLLRLLNDLLDVGRVESGRLVLEQTTFALPATLQQVLGLMAVEADRKGLELRIIATTDTPEYLVGDPLRLEQILFNLVGNAVKFTAAGRVELTITPCKAGPDKVLLTFTVTDTGIGMTPEQRAGIFEPFVQGENSTARRFGGAGLGLTICRRLVELMGSELMVTSEPGVGSAFSFTVRFGVGKAADVSQIEPFDSVAVTSACRALRVLVAEDNPFNQEVVRELLEQVGATVTLAGNGREAVATLNTAPDGFDLVLMDLQMPELDGYGATRLIREQWSADRLPIIALTAHGSAEERRRCRDSGMNDHLAKPVTPDRFYDCLMKWVGPLPRKGPLPAGQIEESPSLPDAIPGLDIAAGIENLGGSSRLYRKLVIAFGESLVVRCADLRSALEAGEWNEAGELIHSLKGAAGTAAATRLRSCVLALEAALKQGPPEPSDHLFAELADAATEVRNSAALLAGSPANAWHDC